MLEPTKYTNISLSVVGLSAEIIKNLKEFGAQPYSQVLRKIIYKNGIEARKNFVLSLVFLFTLSKIKYHKKNDIIELF